MGEIVEIMIAVTTTGSAGSATGNTTSSEYVTGEILDIYLDYHASAPATIRVRRE